MASLKTEINLRPPEFQKQNEFYLPRVIKTVLVLIGIAALGCGIFYLEIYRAGAAAELSLLQLEVESLERRIETIRDLERELSEIKAVKELEEKLFAERHYWSNYLQEIDHVALGMVSLLRVEAPDSSTIFIFGEGEGMEAIASFAERISGLKFINKAELVSVKRLEQGRYSFQVIGEIVDKGEPVEDGEA
ncbi:MAG: PilN domain-containing protein [Dethiobacteria bacterium]